MLEAHGLECVRGERRVFQGLSFAVGSGDCVQLMGANGSGKTSLLRMLCGLLPPASGQICWQGKPIQKLGEEYAFAVTYLGHRTALKDELSAVENLRVASGLAGCDISQDDALAALCQLGLTGYEASPARSLSEGQRRRLMLARLVVSQSPLWLLDEVLSSLDVAATHSITSLIDRHLTRGGMAVVATHQEFTLCGHMLRRIDLSS